MTSWKRLRSRGARAFGEYQETGDLGTLAVAVAAMQQGLAARPQDGSGHAMMLANVGVVLLAQYQEDGKEKNLEAALDAARRSVTATSSSNRNFAAYLSFLGNALLAHYKRSADISDLDAAVDAGRRSVSEATSAGHADLPMYLNNLAIALTERYQQGGGDTDADEAIGAAERAATLASSQEDFLRPATLGTLGNALMARFAQNRDSADLQAAVAASDKAVRETQPADPGLATRLSSLGNVLRIRYERFGDDSDLGDSIDVGMRAVVAARQGQAGLGAMLTNLATALGIRFAKNGNEQDLDLAIEAGTQAVIAAPAGHSDRPLYVSNLGYLWRVRSAFNGSAEDLELAIEAAQWAVDASPPTHPNLPLYLANLVTVLQDRYARGGDARDLEAAIAASRRGVAAASSGSWGPLAWSNLGTSLFLRFVRSWEITDLEGAYDALREAAGLVEPGDLYRPMLLCNFALVVMMRSAGIQDWTDLDIAVDALREAAGLMEPGDLSRPTCLSSLGTALWARFGVLHDRTDLDAAIDATAQAISTSSDGQPDRGRYYDALSDMLRARLSLTGDDEDLAAATTAATQAVKAVPDGDPRLAAYRSTLATCLQTRFERTGAPADLSEAIDYWRQAAGQANASADSRLEAARSWGAAAARAGRRHEAAEGYTAAIGLMPAAAWRGLHRASREAQITELAGLAADGTACAIGDGDQNLALRLAEQGRSVLWNQALDMRGDLTRLAQAAPGLADRLDQIRTVLDAPESGAMPVSPWAWLTENGPTSTGGSGQATQVSATLLVDERMALAREWDELVEKVRQRTGFSDFLRMSSLETLRDAAADGPVAVVNVSDWRCDALIVTPAGVHVQELPRLDANTVVDQANEYLRVQRAVDLAAYELYVARHRFDSGDRDPAVFRIYTSAKQTVQDAVRERDQVLEAILAWLWDEIADPVLTACGYTAPQAPGADPPRLWWCPTGPLTMLPLHAAGHFTDEPHDPPRTVMSRVVSSYTPTLRALLEARHPLPRQPDAGRALIVTVPDAEGLAPLTGTALERRLVAALFPGRHTVLDGPDATWAAVRRELPHHEWAHFSCHGGQDVTDPSHGGLRLHDRMLSVVDVSTEQYRGEFAFLSSCMTATGGVRLTDEAVTLAAALHYRGYRHVIGTLWSVYDDNAAALAEAVYQDLVRAGPPSAARSAYALHNAILSLRKAQDLPPSAWAPFAHIGP